MDEGRLDRALSGLRRGLRAGTAGKPQVRTDCLSFGRLRLLVLDPLRRTSQEEEHLADCRRCRTLLASFETDLPHLPTWTLIRARLGRPSAREQRMLTYHLVAGRCRDCLRRQEQLAQSTPSILVLPTPAVPVSSCVVQAAVPGPEVLAAAAGEGLEAELVQYCGELSLELRTRRTPLNGALAAYSFQNASGEGLLEGYVVLGPDVEGWYTAEVPIGRDLYQERVGERCDQLWVGIVEPEFLSEAEWSRLQEAAPGPQSSPHQRDLWRDWCARTLLSDRGMPAGARAVLQSLTERLR